nr:penicillin-binding protein 1C [Trichothermofontia sichuanensis]
MLSGVGVRYTPYLMPIRASDIVQEHSAWVLSDRNGLPLGTILSRDQEHTMGVALDQVSPQFIQAILAAEDSRFYQHGPVDLAALARAIVQAIQARRIVSGASTVTMQLARMIYPTPRTPVGKLQEIWIAWRLAAGMSRDEILHAYINRLPMGGNVYGVEAAARLYLDLPAAHLNLAQASLLAALPNDPTALNPYVYWAQLKQRQRYVLDRLVATGRITATEADHAYAETIHLQDRQQGILAAPHFLFWVANQVEQSPGQATGVIRTTLDRPLQEFVETQVRQLVQGLALQNVRHAAAIVVDNHTGDILAYVGSPNYFDTDDLGRNDGVQALRQPGSTLKPFLYQLALARGVISPNTVLADVPTHYAIPGAQLYSPTDYSETFQGPVRVRSALANSLNIPAVRVLERVGVAAFRDRLRELGFEHLTRSPEYYGLGLALGAGEVSLWELARAYVTLARGGEAIALRGWLGEAPLKMGFTTKAPRHEGARREEGAWELVRDMLGDRYARAGAFGVASVLDLPFAAAVKTGTSSDFRDTWTVGFSRDYTVATWVGNFDGSAMRTVSGVTGAAPLWQRIMLHLHEHQEPAGFAPPTGLVPRPICAISGARPTPACPIVVREYLFPTDLAAYEHQPDPFLKPIPGQPDRYHWVLSPEYHEWLAQREVPAWLQTTVTIAHENRRVDIPPANPNPIDLSQTTQTRQSAIGVPKIAFPQTGDRFILHPAENDSPAAMQHGPSQRLEFTLTTQPDTEVEWWLNGQKLATQPGRSYFWTVQPGHWTLTVKSAAPPHSRAPWEDTVTFQVDVANIQHQKRGFTIRDR